MKINSDNYHSDWGFSAIGMVIILLLLGGILLHGLSRSSLSWQKSFVYEKQYYHRFNQAYSAIEWAKTQTWQQPTSSWQCQTQTTYQLNACIVRASLTKGNYVIIRGRSKSFSLYHLATYQAGKLIVEKGHWLDYCPEHGDMNCDK